MKNKSRLKEAVQKAFRAGETRETSEGLMQAALDFLIKGLDRLVTDPAMKGQFSYKKNQDTSYGLKVGDRTLGYIVVYPSGWVSCHIPGSDAGGYHIGVGGAAAKKAVKRVAKEAHKSIDAPKGGKVKRLFQRMG